MNKVEQRAWELLEAECGKSLSFNVPTHAALRAIITALSQQSTAHLAITHCDNCGCDWLDNGLNPIGCPYCKKPDTVSMGDCTTNGADVWCNGHIVATAHGFTLALYRAARIATCLNACAGIEDPVAFIQKAKERFGGEEKRGPLAHSRNVIRQSLHWNGVPVHVTGTVTTSPGNWSLIDAALATQHREPNDADRR